MLRNLNRKRAAGTICGTCRTGARKSEFRTGGTYPTLLENDTLLEDPPEAEYSTQLDRTNLVGTLVGPDELGQFTYTPPANFIGSVTIPEHVRVYGPTGLLREYDEVIVFSFGTPVSADFTASYSVGGMVSADFAASFKVNATVGADFGAAFSVNQFVQVDLTAAYQVDSPAASFPVSADFAASYEVAMAISADFSANYGMGGTVSQDFSSSYRVLDTDEPVSPVATLAAAGRLPPRPRQLVGIRVGY